MFGIGAGELFVIFLVVFIFFGPKALPDIAKSLGQVIRAFKKEVSQISKDTESDQSGSSKTIQKEDKNNIPKAS